MSSGGFLVRYLGGMAVGMAAAALVVGCAVSQRHVQQRTSGVLGAGEESGAWASPDELAWLRKVGIWNVHVRRGLVSGSSFVTNRGSLKKNATAGSLAHAVAPDRSCAADLAAQVGPPPTQRLQRAWRLLRDACTHLRSFGSELTSAAGSDDQRYVQAAGLDANQGSDLLLHADRLLPPGEVRSLPVVAGVTAASHVDPRFSRIVGQLAHHRVEARCWSRDDWTRVMREETTYTLHRIAAGAIAFAALLGNRDNFSPSVCDQLEALAYRHSLPTNPTDELSLAQALVALAHEPQHSRGISSEAQAECYAIQLMPKAAIQLGAPPRYAATLQQLFWSHYDDELPSYRSPECRNGGAYDLRPSDPAFP